MIKDTSDHKIVTTPDYNMYFNKHDGTMLRWGKTYSDDPQLAPMGPEILDLEISVGDCFDKCSWCYKSNTAGNGKHMNLESLQVILDKVGKQLTQVAFGITDANSNLAFPAMLRYCREQGVIPNYTTSGLGMTEELFTLSAKICGAVAVSVYPHQKNLAYDTIDRFLSTGVKQTNIHLLYYQENLKFVHEVIQDVSNGDISPNTVVLLALKTKGRGINLTSATEEQFNEIVDNAMIGNVPLGFDSCSAPKFEKWAKDNGEEDLLLYSEPCESALMSSYVNVEGEFFPCSFVEGTEDWEQGLSVLNCDNFLKDIWFHPRVIEWRKVLLNNCRNCPVFEI